MTENKDTRIALENIISVLSESPYDPLPSSPLALSLMGAFHHAVQTATMKDEEPAHSLEPIREPWKEVFWSEVATVARTLLAEQDLEDNTFTMQEWLDLRVLTISGNSPPFPIPIPFCSSCLFPSVAFSSQLLYYYLYIPNHPHSIPSSHLSKANTYIFLLQHDPCLYFSERRSDSRPPQRL